MLDWLARAGMLSEAEHHHLSAPRFQSDLTQAATDLRALRDQFRGFIADTAGQPQTVPGHAMIDRLNALLAKGRQHLQIDPSLSLITTHRMRSPGDLLPRVAAACAHMIAAADFRYVRQCEGPTCTLWFLDVSKNHKRRWCSMEVCGNRAKAAAFRERNKRT